MSFHIVPTAANTSTALEGSAGRCSICIFQLILLTPLSTLLLLLVWLLLLYLLILHLLQLVLPQIYTRTFSQKKKKKKNQGAIALFQLGKKIYSQLAEGMNQRHQNMYCRQQKYMGHEHAENFISVQSCNPVAWNVPR